MYTIGFEDFRNEHKQQVLSQKNTPNASDEDMNANELSVKTEKAALFVIIIRLLK